MQNTSFVMRVGLALASLAGCGLQDDRAPVDDGASEVVQAALSPNPCTAVKLTSPAAAFPGAVGIPITLSAAATCPAGQTPEYQYWAKRLGAPNWTRLGAYVPGSSAWAPPTSEPWCVTVVARAIGASESYQTRGSARCMAPRCGNATVEAGEQCDDGNTTDGDGCDSNCTLPVCGNAIVDAGEQCDDGNTANGDGCDDGCVRSAMTYVKASSTHAGDYFGTAIAISTDGSTLAVGAYGEGNSAGAVSVFVKRDGTWSQQAYLKASNASADDLFGDSVALSADGSTLAVGAPGEASAASGVGGNQSDNSLAYAGAVYVFTRSAATWSQQAYLKASHPDDHDIFGGEVALSADGSTLAVAALLEDGGVTSVGVDPADNSAPDAGAIYVFTRAGAAWSQQAYVKGSLTHQGAGLGYGMALSADGSRLAAGAPFEGDGTARGAVYIFERIASTWSEQAHLVASTRDNDDNFGWGLALSADGSTLAAGAPGEDSSATGINGDQSNNAAQNTGALYVFVRSSGTWTQQAYLKASNTESGNTGMGDQLGLRAAISADGATVAVAAPFESSAATGINGDQADNSLIYPGAVYLFTRSAASWSQRAYVKASNTGAFDELGYRLALSGDGTLAMSAIGEASAATGIGGDQLDNSAPLSGAVYLLDIRD